MMKMKMNSKFVYLVFHPGYLVDLLRAGGRFPKSQAFALPTPDSNESEIEEFIDKKFPSLSEDRYEIWLKFSLPDELSGNWLSLEDIVSAHFYSNHRKDATSAGELHTLKVYGIPVLEPIEQALDHVFEKYYSKVREHAAKSVVKAWFKDVTISGEFIEQLEIGYKYQQSPAPEKLPAISSKFIWAHLVSYNPGLRKFEERPLVLWLQDIQEVIKRTDDNLKQKLKSIGDKYESKFSSIIDSAEKDRKIGNGPSKWIIENRKNENSYFSELDNYLSQLGSQQSFFFSALLYLNWRESLLNRDYAGKLADHKEVGAFLNIPADYPMRRAIAEALFTIVYAGGPRVFQQALIEARIKTLGLGEPNKPKLPKTPTLPQQPVPQPLVSRLFENLKKGLGKVFDTLLKGFDAEKKKETQKKIEAICGNKTKMAKGEFSHEQYLSLCLLFDIPVEQFDDYPVATEAKAVDSTDQSESAGKISESPIDTEEQTSVSEQKGANEDFVNESEAPPSKNDDPSDDPKGDHVSKENQAKTKPDSTLDQPESAASGSESSDGTQEVTSVEQQRNANEDSVNEFEASIIKNDDSSGDANKDYIPSEGQTESNSGSTSGQTKSADLNADSASETNEQSGKVQTKQELQSDSTLPADLKGDQSDVTIEEKIANADQKKSDATRGQLESAAKVGETSIVIEVHTSGAEQKDAKENSVSEFEITAGKNYDSSGDTKENQVSGADQTETKQIATPDLKEAEENTSGANQEGKKEDSTSDPGTSSEKQEDPSSDKTENDHLESQTRIDQTTENKLVEPNDTNKKKSNIPKSGIQGEIFL